MPAFGVSPVGPADLDDHDSLLQSAYWARLKGRFGWSAAAFRLEAGGRSFPLLVLLRGPARGPCLAYCPHGPVVDCDPGADVRGPFLAELSEMLLPHLPASCAFLRFDLPWARPEGDDWAPPAPLVKAPVDIQAPDTVLLDIALSEEELLAAMKPKTRYNIGLAARKGVVVREGGAADLDAWNVLSAETARRDRIAVHSPAYTKALFEEAANSAVFFGAARGSSGLPRGAERQEMHLLLAEVEGGTAAALILAVRGSGAVYLYGASGERYRNFMPTYALQWEAIRLARRRGCVEYDLFGIPPTDDPSHPMHGLYRVKTGFGGRIVRRLGCFDAPHRRGVYAVYRRAEAARIWYYRRLRKMKRRPGR